ncbi:MAG TPA: right-handed parallel beta-helix repeat-containing protein, partial [Candidatus Binataceae bacterium]
MAAAFAALALLAAGDWPHQQALAIGAPGAVTEFAAGANLAPDILQPRPSFTFYVARDGNDNWSGTLKAPSNGNGPFATVARARDAIRALKAGGRLAGPVSVQIRAGTYYLQTPLVLTPLDSGTPSGPISYQSYPGETAVLSGGQPIRGWRRLGDGERSDVSAAAHGSIWVADVPRGTIFNNLFINGSPLTRSAMPATTDWRTWPRATPARGVVDGFFFSPGAFPSYSDAASAEVNVVPFIGSHAVNFLEPVARLDFSSGMIAFSPNARPYEPMKVTNGAYFRVENILGALTGPGQWSLDAARGKVYCWPPAGVSLNAAEVTAPHLRMAIDLRGSEDQGLVRFINFSGLTIAYFDRARRDEPFPPSPKVRLIWAETQDSAILMRGVEDCSIQRCRITDVGGMGVRATHHASRIRIVNNQINNCGGSAIAFEGYEPGIHDVNRDDLIARNTIYHCAQSSWRGSAITLLQAGNITVADNRISDLPYCGIFVSGYPLSYFRVYKPGA